VGWARGDTVQANVPVVLSGVGVIPGQYVFADSSGAVMIPPGDLERALAEARSIKADDARYREEIAPEDGPAP
jgi:4-hydroxy-4-methyl-2-oxoglutarate aldolase